MRNIENCRMVLDQIEQHPETWDQTMWHCGTTHCFAGWAQIFYGKSPNSDTAEYDAQIYLNFTEEECDYYFRATRTLDELKKCVRLTWWEKIIMAFKRQ